MPKVKVWNDNKYPYSEEFRGKKISIGPGEYILMEDDEAILFRGTYSPIFRDADGQVTPQSYKIIRIEEIKDQQVEKKESTNLLCQACGYVSASNKDLEEHIDANHLDQLEDKDEALKARKKKAS